ncbi:MAG: carbohydrate ABC transporter substrate-binding protein [Pseudobutyrivibrio sp.]|nr:carbohydrate ABC transporter substrate-binding protein [Treponema sp.]MBR5951944.1 carbohydrate ABC transporter substrate-binding protein [Pseudobutyrivibrio sp.]
MKKSSIILGLAACAALAFVTGCKKTEGAAAGDSGKTKLSVWSFTDEIGGFIDNPDYGYKVTHPNVEVEYTFTPTDQFPSKLDPVLASGNGAPDVFGLEDAFVRKYVESGLLLELDDLYAQVKDKMADYPMKVGSYNGHVYGMSWQVAPGALFYRRSYAKKYWGTDDPVEVQKKVADLPTFMASARQLLKDSNGKCKIVSTSGDLFMPYKGARKKPWIVDDKLYIDPAMEDYMEMAKTFYDEELDGRTSQWAEGWYAGMNDTLKDEKGNDLEVMCYFLPTWGLHYVLKTDASKTAGDWAMCAGPAPYRWGGTWIAAYKGTKQPEAAKEMIRYIATDDSFLEAMAKASGDCVGNYNVQNKIKDTFSEPYLGGQNHYAQFCEMAKTVDGSLTQGTDQQIESLWNESVTAYAMGEKSKEDALAAFKDQVATTMGY